jgi:predicted alpha/beta hydrolase
MQTVQRISGRVDVQDSSCRVTPHEIRVEERFDLVTRDGVRLAATLHAPVGEPKAALQINAGTGIKRQFYRHFAAYFAARGYAVLTFDMRGMGDSLHEPLARCKATMFDWAQKDMPTALDWLAQRYPKLPRFAIGHCLGAQLTGLMPNHELLDGLVFVFAPKGDLYEGALKGKVLGTLFMGIYMPLTIPLFGYARVSSLLAAENLPAGVARDWTRLLFHRGWVKGVCAERGEKAYYHEITAPILALSVDTDFYAPPKACAKLLSEYYTGSESELINWRAADAAEPSQLTHLGFFRRKFAESHWSQVAAWLDRRVERLVYPAPESQQALTA